MVLVILSLYHPSCNGIIEDEAYPSLKTESHITYSSPCLNQANVLVQKVMQFVK
jgi:hypothetical protein